MFDFYCKGVCFGKTRCGGFAVIIKRNKKFLYQRVGSKVRTTNIRMEVLALLKGLELFESFDAKKHNLVYISKDKRRSYGKHGKMKKKEYRRVTYNYGRKLSIRLPIHVFRDEAINVFTDSNYIYRVLKGKQRIRKHLDLWQKIDRKREVLQIRAHLIKREQNKDASLVAVQMTCQV